MRVSSPIALRFLVLSALAFTASCGPQPAHDYVATGTLRFAPGMQLDFESKVTSSFQRLQEVNGVADLVMTARTSPDVGDIIVQRRWMGVKLPHEFGLGKKRGDILAANHDSVYLTAVLSIYANREAQRGGQPPIRKYVGWTAKPVDIGSMHLDLELSELYGAGDAARPGYPKGGWASQAATEEAVPPGLRIDPGPFAFGGSVDVDPGARHLLRNFSVFIMARARADRGFPELITAYDDVVFPFKFSLHQFNRQDQTTNLITDPKFVVAMVDADGNVGTKDDQAVIATAEKVEPGTKNIALNLDVRPLLQKIVDEARAGGAGSRPTGSDSRPSSPESRPTGSDEGEESVLATGTLTMAQGATAKSDAVLWISLKNPDNGSILFVSRKTKPTFPHTYELKSSDDMMGSGGKFEGPFVVSMILSSEGPNPKAAGALVAASKTVTKGAQGVDLELAAP